MYEKIGQKIGKIRKIWGKIGKFGKNRGKIGKISEKIEKKNFTVFF